MSSGLMSGGYHANKGNVVRSKMEASHLASELERLRNEHDALKRREVEMCNAQQAVEQELEAEKMNEKVMKE